MELDPRQLQALVKDRLPVRARWVANDTPMDFDFSIAQSELRPLEEQELQQFDPAWSQFLIFGDCDYGEGGGAHPWLGIRKSDGSVCGLDPERETPLFLINSSIEQFVRTFAFLDQYLGEGRKPPADSGSYVRHLDPEAYDSSDWRTLIEYLESE